MGYAILNAAAFLHRAGVRRDCGMGIMVPKRGFMVSGEWWIALFPGLALMIAVICFTARDGCAISSIRSGGRDDCPEQYRATAPLLCMGCFPYFLDDALSVEAL